MGFLTFVVLVVLAIVIGLIVGTSWRTGPVPRMHWGMTLEEAETVLERASAAGQDHEWVGKQLEFDYRDTKGDTTRRRVLVTSVFRSGSHQYLKGHCQMRDDERNFRMDRVSGDIVDVGTGEVVRRGRARRKTTARGGERKRKAAPRRRKKG